MTFAEGNLAKIIIGIIIAAVVVVAGTVLTPWSAEYEVKTAARIGCAALMKSKKFNPDPSWEDTFVRKARGAGVPLKKGQYLFDIVEVKNEGLWRCHFKAAWRSTTPWLALSAVFPELPPLVYVNRIDQTYDVKTSF